MGIKKNKVGGHCEIKEEALKKNRVTGHFKIEENAIRRDRITEHSEKEKLIEPINRNISKISFFNWEIIKYN